MAEDEVKISLVMWDLRVKKKHFKIDIKERNPQQLTILELVLNSCL